MTCPKCGFTLSSGANFCLACGANTTQPTPPQPEPQSQQSTSTNQWDSNPQSGTTAFNGLPPTNHFSTQPPKPRKKVNPAGMILGIIATYCVFMGIIFACIPPVAIGGIVCGLIGLCFAIPARILGVKGERDNVRLSKPGKILGTISIVIGSIAIGLGTLLAVLFFTFLGSIL